MPALASARAAAPTIGASGWGKIEGAAVTALDTRRKSERADEAITRIASHTKSTGLKRKAADRRRGTGRRNGCCLPLEDAPAAGVMALMVRFRRGKAAPALLGGKVVR